MNPRDALDMFRRKGGARCIEIGRQIQTYLDSGLDPTTAAKVSSHLHACHRCGLTADDYRRLKAALAETTAPMPAEPLQRLQALAAAVVVDLTKRRFRLPTVRVTLFLLQYRINDSIEILLAPIYWMAAAMPAVAACPRRAMVGPL